MMKKYILICVFAFLSILSKAQKVDTVAKKIAHLPYTQCEIPPRLKNGLMIERYFPDNFNKIKEIKGDYTGSVIVSLFIDSLGKLVNMQLIKSQSPEIDKEALRVLSKTKWKPAINNFAHINYNLVINIWIANKDPNYYQVTCGAPAISAHIGRGYGEVDSLGKVSSGVEKEPEFPGGTPAFVEYFNSNVRYPEVAQRNYIKGIVFVTFTVEKNGSLTNFLVLSSPDDELSLEALRVLKQCPKFNPGMRNGTPVRVQYTMPLTFRLPN